MNHGVTMLKNLFATEQYIFVGYQTTLWKIYVVFWIHVSFNSNQIDCAFVAYTTPYHNRTSSSNSFRKHLGFLPNIMPIIF